MQQRVLSILEFDKIKEMLREHASSPLGEEWIKELLPSSDFSEVIINQEETDEAFAVLRVKGHVPLSGIYDIRPHIKRAEIGGMLHPQELTQIGSTIHASRMIRKFIEELQESELSLKHLPNLMEQIVVLAELEEAIKKAIDESGAVLDSASETLRQLRQQLKTKENRVRERLEAMIRSSNAQKMLSDQIITIRNDRFVIPVKQEYRGHYGGIIHDQSSSGQTLFIEPEGIVQLNNELQEIRVKEQQEIERILLELTSFVAEHSNELKIIVDCLGKIDFLFAKGRFAHVMKASKPMMNNEGRIRLLKARHPFIPMDKVVANDIYIGDEFTTMVITGPNTGGKTVTLKTVGICALMAQSGLFIPALDGSEMAVFASVYADIGDEQSIEQSLSTFSSHMVNIVDILNKADGNSLILFDELGAGTDPQEGAALAISILDEVYKRGARVIATTHYPELKAYGYNRDGVMNASVEFDVDTLSPTYKLLIGVPGRSNAFEISKKLGLKEHIIEKAKTFIGTETNEVEGMIAALDEKRKEAELEVEQAHRLLEDAERLHAELKKYFTEFENKKEALLEKARDKARQIVEKAKIEAEEVISQLRKMQLESQQAIKEHEFIEARKRLEDVLPAESKPKKVQGKTKQQLMVNDEVMVLTFNQKGQLLEKVSDEEWLVQIGIMKMKVHEKDIEFVKREEKVETNPIATVKGKDFHVKLELDLRGERYEDALLRVEKYIDDALLAGYPRVSIIHGKGTGALRQGVQQYLRNHRSVKNIRFGDAAEGGTGVTIVEFK